MQCMERPDLLGLFLAAQAHYPLRLCFFFIFFADPVTSNGNFFPKMFDLSDDGTYQQKLFQALLKSFGVIFWTEILSENFCLHSFFSLRQQKIGIFSKRRGQRTTLRLVSKP